MLLPLSRVQAVGPGSPLMLDKAKPNYCLRDTLSVAAFVTPIGAEFSVAHFGQKSFRSRKEIGRAPWHPSLRFRILLPPRQTKHHAKKRYRWRRQAM
jgi:hypothetical protein